MRAVVPIPGTDSISMLPPIASTASFVIGKPQPKADAWFLARPPIEAVEQPAELRGRNANASVYNIDLHRLPS